MIGRLCLILAVVASASAQNGGVDDLGGLFDDISPPPPPAAGGDSSTTTTPSPRYSACMNACQTVSSYNPVCGSDGNTYSNQQRLQCARRCGSNVQLVRGGTCQPLS
ncbi:uncharacterized protein LOC132700721 [Cylas formicarius]|uniref:uncharacterized protein LOC132700721 n=1 Tax=Cylas formicarius TaxID=197179 RepID=UPI00295831AE|nr:uncharacterized protein LOC132700721 [Cylas formicarius]